MQRVIALLLAVAASAAVSRPSSAALVVHEPYAYTEGSDISDTSGGTGWVSNWRGNQALTTLNATGDTAGTGSLSYVDSLGNTLATSGNKGVYAGTLNTAAANGTTSNAFRQLPAIRGQEGVA